MGNRALVIFYDQRRISPTVYLHWNGGNVPELLGELAEYAAARFTGLCHKLMPGNLSLGIIANRLRRAYLEDAAVLETMSHGDAGVIVVDTRDFTWKAYGGYLAGNDRGQP